MENDNKKMAVALSIQSVTKMGDREQNQKQELPGMLYLKEGTWYLRYEEEDQEKGKISSTLKVQGEQVTIIRQGSFRMNHTFLLGQETSSSYVTPYGVLEMNSLTLDFSFRPPEEEPGRLHLHYWLTLQGEEVGQIQLQIRLNLLH